MKIKVMAEGGKKVMKVHDLSENQIKMQNPASDEGIEILHW